MDISNEPWQCQGPDNRVHAILSLMQNVLTILIAI